MKAYSFKGMLFLIVAALAAGQILSASPAQQAEVKTENGVRVVHNPKTPITGPGGKRPPWLLPRTWSSGTTRPGRTIGSGS